MAGYKRFKSKKDLNTSEDVKNYQPECGNMFSRISLYVLTFSLLCTILIHFLYSRENTDFSSRLEAQLSLAQSPNLYWGSYRPNLYFGLKTRSPDPVMFGLLWITQKKDGSFKPVRHSCEISHGLRYSWRYHDGENFGVHEIFDDIYNIQASFVKTHDSHTGGDWTVRIEFEQNHEDKVVDSLKPVFAVSYFSLDSLKSWLYGIIPPSKNSRTRQPQSAPLLKGYHDEFGLFSVNYSVSTPKDASNLLYQDTFSIDFPSSAHSFESIESLITKNLNVFSASPKTSSEEYAYIKVAKDISLSLNNQNAYTRAKKCKRCVIGIAVSSIYSFSIEISFLTNRNDLHTQPNFLIGRKFDSKLKQHKKEFSERFTRTFPFKWQNQDLTAVNKISESVFSNLIGGIGYFYGSSRVRSENGGEFITRKKSLFTSVPSRSFFPRGFLWDEGFHNLVMLHWNANLSMQIMSTWLLSMDENGWIAREQILGKEAENKVPEEFIVQDPRFANPPTFFLTLDLLVEKYFGGSENMSHFKTFFENSIIYFDRWLTWFNTTQRGKVSGSFMWKGRSLSPQSNDRTELNSKTFTSGLDDYPRSSHPSEDERHVDLMCWMFLASRIMTKLAAMTNHTSLHEKYVQFTKSFTTASKLDKLHWSVAHGMYADFGHHTNDIQLKTSVRRLANGENEKFVTRLIKTKPSHRYVDAFGYISLFPLIVKAIDPESEKLGIVLGDIRDPNKIWTSFGLRSLSRNSSFYKVDNTIHDPPYWRGNIWININYLVLASLKHYSLIPDCPYRALAQSTYEELRQNLLTNMLKEWKSTGFLWENYNDETGRGQGAHPFTGWSSLFILIGSEQYVH